MKKDKEKNKEKDKTICSCGEEGTLRVPYIADKKVAKEMAYYACDSCFEATWAGAE